MISIEQAKLSNLPAKLCVFGPKMKIFLKIFMKILRFFDQNLYGKFTFFTIFYLIFLGFLTPLRKYIPLEDTTRFLQQFFLFLGGGTFRRSPPLPTLLLISNLQGLLPLYNLGEGSPSEHYNIDSPFQCMYLLEFKSRIIIVISYIRDILSDKISSR